MYKIARGKRVKKKWVVLLLALFFVSSGCGREVQTVTENRLLMDTLVSINVYALKPADESPIRRAIAAAFAEMSRLDSLFSAYRADSEVAKLNREATMAGVAITNDMDSVLQASQWAAQISGGAFDITVAPILRLWGFGTDSLGLPAPEKIAGRRAYVDYENLVITSDAANHQKSVTFRQPGMAIDLGGVAKGYVVDRGLAALQRAGIRDAMITAGGDLRTITSPLTAGRRYIWIQHPRPANPDSASGSFFGRFKLEGDAAVSTSGDYERFFINDNKRYHHIVDPHTGYPADKAISATVIAATSIQADALSTALFVLGPERGIALADSLPAVEAVIFYKKGDKLEWETTKILQEKLEVFNR